MNSRDRVLAVFDRKIPDKVPRWCGASEEFWIKAKKELSLNDEELRIRFGDDFRRVFSSYRGPIHDKADNVTWESPFGVQRTGIGYGQPTTHPLKDAETIDQVESYPWPDPGWADISNVRKDAEKWEGEYAVLGGEWSPVWHDVIDLVGHEQLYYMMYDYPEVALKIFEKVTDYYMEVSSRTFREASDLIDIYFIGNDLGGQNGPLLGLDLFKQFVMPSLQRLFDLGHSHNLKVMMHCCGGFRQLIPTLIEVELDGLHALQPDARGMDPQGLKQDFGKDIVLNGAIDSHNILINGASGEFVTEQTKLILELMKPGGMYISGASHDTILEETPVGNVLAMFDAIEEFGKY